MRTTLRTVALLSGFYLVTFGLLAGLGTLAVALEQRTAGRGAGTAAEIWVITAIVAFPLLYGLYAVRGERGRRPTSGLRVTAEQQPDLWARAARAAAAEGAPAPHELWLTTDDTAVSLRQPSRLLGVVPGRRRLVVGVPRLAALTEQQVDAELEHVLGQDSRAARAGVPLAGLVRRNRQTLQQILDRFQRVQRSPDDSPAPASGAAALFSLAANPSALLELDLGAVWNPARWFGRIYTSYARLCLRRGQAAVEPAPQDPATGAAAPGGYQRFLHAYADIGWEAGVVPIAADVIPAYREWLRGPADGASPAIDLLVDPERTCALIVARRPGYGERRQIGWNELAAVAGQAELDAETAPLRTSATAVLRRSPDLPTLLDAIDAGRWAELADWIPRIGAARTVPVEVGRAMNLAVASDGLYSLALGALVQQGRGRWTLDRARGRGKRLELDEGLDAALGPCLDSAVADPPDTAALRRLLAVPGADPAPAADQ